MIVYLGIGSNIDAVENIMLSKSAIRSVYANTRFSRTFESEAVGFTGDNFLNLVAEISTEETLAELMSSLKQLEAELGRVRGEQKFSSRKIDIDILLYGDLVCQQPIILPREEIRENAYVLWPLAELAADLVEPGGEKSYQQLWQEFDQSSQQLTPID